MSESELVTSEVAATSVDSGAEPALAPTAAPRDPRFMASLAVVTAGAFVLRLVYVLTLARRNPTGGDPLYYHVQANLLADHKGYSEPFTWLSTHRLIPTAVHPPLVSTLLAVSSFLGGRSFFAHKMVACVAGTGTVFVVGLVAHRIAGPRAGIIAAVLAAIYPNLWLIDGILMPETFFALTIALVILTAYRWLDAPSVGRSIVLGIMIALAALTRGEAVLPVVLLGVPLVLVARQLATRRRLVLLVVIGLAAGITVLPWQLRNMARFDRTFLLSTNGDELLAYANCDTTYYGDIKGWWDVTCHFGNPTGDESDRAHYWREQGLTYVKNHERRLPVVLAARLGRTWELYRPEQNVIMASLDGRNVRVQRAALYMYYPLVALSVYACVLLRRRRVSLVPVLVPFAMVTVTVLYAYGATRFRAPAEVSLVLLGGIAIDGLLTAFVRRRATRSVAP